MSEPTEIHVEHLIGRSVRDVDNRVVGRIEELVAEYDGDVLVVMEVHVGPQALHERLGGAALQLPLLDRLPVRRRRYRIDSRLLDLSDAHRPRVSCRRADLPTVSA